MLWIVNACLHVFVNTESFRFLSPVLRAYSILPKVVRKSDVFACSFLKSLLKSGVTSESEATVLYEKAFFNGRGNIGQIDPEALLMNEFAFQRFWLSLYDQHAASMMGAFGAEDLENDDYDDIEDDEEYDWYEEDEIEDDEEEEEEDDSSDSGEDEYGVDVDDYEDEYEDDDDEDDYGYEDEYDDEYDDEYTDGAGSDVAPELDYDLGGLFATVRPPSMPKKQKGARRSEL